VEKPIKVLNADEINELGVLIEQYKKTTLSSGFSVKTKHN
jgi:hypothetical protein